MPIHQVQVYTKETVDIGANYFSIAKCPCWNPRWHLPVSSGRGRLRCQPHPPGGGCRVREEAGVIIGLSSACGGRRTSPPVVFMCAAILPSQQWREVGRNPDPDFNDTLTVCLAVDTMYSHAITNFLACSFFTIFNFAVSTLLFVRGLSAHTTKLTRPHLALTITRVRIASRGVSSAGRR